MGRSTAARATLAIATAFEFVLITSLVAIFTYAYPNRFRTALWEDGGSKGWNSDPRARVYFYANYQEPPAVPMVWDKSLTLYNLCISVLSLVLWGIRFSIRGQSLDIYGAVTTNALYDVLLAMLWTCSAVMQDSGDVSDPEHISLQPWYLDRGCSEAWSRNKMACGAVRASFALTVIAGVWFVIRLLTTCMYGAYVYGQEQGEREGVGRLMDNGMAKWAGLQYDVSDEPLGA